MENKKNTNQINNIISDETNEKLSHILNGLKLCVGDKITLHELTTDNVYDFNYLVLFQLKSGIYEGEDGYYNLVKKPAKINPSLTIKRLTNFTIEAKSFIILTDFNNLNCPNCMWEATIKVEEETFDIVFSDEELKNPKKFSEKLLKFAHIHTLMDEKQHRELMVKIFSKAKKEKNLPTIREFKTAGYNVIDGKEYFVTSNKCIPYAGTSIENLSNIRLSKTALLHPRFADYEAIKNCEEIKSNAENPTPENIVSFILEQLFRTLDKAYKGRIESFMVIAMGYMTLFLKQITKDFTGFPIVALYGEAGSGKSNLLVINAKIYGSNRDFMHGGMDTSAGLIENLEIYVNIPLLIDEIEANGFEAIKSLIKAVFQQIGRKKFGVKNRINTTIFFNSNYIFAYGDEIKSRCIELYFTKDDFDCYEAEKFNKYAEYLSFVSQYIIENVPYEDIRTGIKEEEQSELLSPIKDNRVKRNLAIAITGLKLLIKLVNDKENVNFGQFEDRLKQYIEELIFQKNQHVESIIAILKELLHDTRGKLMNGVDYKITENGVHLLTGRKYGKTFEMHFQKILKQFNSELQPISLKDCIKLLKDNGATMENVHYPKYSATRYGLLLPFDKFEELAYLDDKSGITRHYSTSDDISTLDNSNNPF